MPLRRAAPPREEEQDYRVEASGKNQFTPIYYGCSDEDCSADISCKSVVSGCRFSASTDRMSRTLALLGRL